MSKVGSKGMLAGAIVWLALMAMMSSIMACIDARFCGGEGFFMYALVGVGMLAPAYFVAALFSK